MSDIRDSELRGNVPRRFLELLDAVAQADGVGRMEVVMAVVGPELERRVHAATVLLRCVGVNPLDSDRGADRSGGDMSASALTRGQR